MINIHMRKRNNAIPVCRAIFEDQGYLVSFWLTNLFHDWTFKFF